jgi:hypothetical protein
MSTSIPDTPSRNKKIILWVVIVFLAIAAIGQISAIFIRAMVGQSPDNISIIVTPLWLGLLFMAIWALKSKKKAKGFIIGVVIGFVLNFLAGVTAAYLQAETRAIDEAVEKSNMNLPKMLDEDTRLDSASIDQKSKNYYLFATLVNLTFSEIDTAIIDEHFKQNIKPTTCTNSTLRLFFTEGYSINYVYKDKSGSIVREYAIAPTDC